MVRPSFLESFSKSQISSMIATLADYVILFALVELFSVWYVLATAIGAVVGAVTHFVLNRYWSFRAFGQKWPVQAFRYVLVSVGSLALNSGGVYFVTEAFRIHYAGSVFLVSVLVGVLFNFPLHRYFVFQQS